MLQNNIEPNWLRWLPSMLRDKIVGRQNLHAVIANSGWLLFDKFVRLLLGVVVSAWVARYLGPTQFGQLAYILAYVAFFQAIATLGADGIIVRDIARKPEDAAKILGTAIVFRGLTGVFCWVIAILGIAIFSNGDSKQIIMTAIVGGILVFQAVDTIDLWFQSQSQSRRTVVAKLVAYFLSNSIKVILIISKAPLVAFAIVMLIDAITAAIGLCIAYQYFPTQERWHSIRQQGIQLIRESWPFMLSGLSVMIYMRIDQIMLKNMLGDKDLGIYAAALPLSTVWYFIPMTLYTSLAPYITRKKQESEAVYMQTLSRIFRLFAGLGILITIPIMFLSEFLVSFLYGEGYTQSAEILRIHVIANIFVSLGVAQGLWIINEGKSKITMYRTIIGAVLCIIGNAIFIPVFGVIASAFITVISQFFSTVLLNAFFAPKIMKMQIMGLLQIKMRF